MNWLLLRGLSRETRHWGSFLTAMKKSLGGGTILALDVPGVGTENLENSLLSLKRSVDHLKLRLDRQRQNDEPWTVLGISYGGMLALQWMSMYPDDFSQIVVINSSATDVPVWERIKPKALLTTLQLFFERNVERRESKILQMVSTSHSRDGETLRQWIEIAKTKPVSRLTTLNQLISAGSFSLPIIKNPRMLVLTSQADQMVDWQCSKVIADKYNAEFRVHGLAGHDLPLDDPSWVLSQIKDWSL